MKIEKGKLYYCISGGNVIKSAMDWNDESNDFTDKIAVHCPTEKDFNYVNKVIDHASSYDNYYPYKILTDEGFSYKKHYCEKENYHIITIDQFKKFYPPISKEETNEKAINTQSHYDNTHGSLYQIAEQRGWNSYQFDIVKRIDRALKKGQFKEDLQKTKDLIDLWLREVK